MEKETNGTTKIDHFSGAQIHPLDDIEVSKGTLKDLTKLLLKQKALRSRIYDFLGPKDSEEIMVVNKKFKKISIAELKKRKSQRAEPLTFDGILKKMISKSKKKPKRNVFKTKLYSINATKMIEPYKWVLLNPTEKDHHSLAEDLKGIIPAKFFKNFSKQIFYCPEIRKYIILNRGFTDAKMEIDYKLRQRAKEKLDSTAEAEKSDFQKVAESQELAIENFIGAENGMLMRQRLLLEKLEELKKTKEESTEVEDSLKLLNALSCSKMSIVLCKGGSFSIGLFENGKEIAHKSDKKYVVRKKQGGRQAVAIGNASNSAGGQMRYNNEVIHQENISKILGELKQLIEKCDFNFVHAPGINKSILFDEGRVLHQLKDSGKFRSLGLDAKKKANFSEVKRLYEEINKVYIVSEEDY